MSDPEDPGGAADHLHHVVVADEQSLPVDVEALVRLAHHALGELRVPDGAELSIVLAEPERMAELKGEWLGDPAPTDVLAFPMDGLELDANGPLVLGDVVLCPSVASEQAASAGHPAAVEMNLLLVHGILHLIGHDHAEPSEKTRMWAEQDRILAGAAR
jgi:probable rRNA maturation factor